MTHSFLRNSATWTFRLIMWLALLSTLSLFGTAQTAGYDQFQTGAGTTVTLDGIGQINLQGVAIQGSTGNADTIIHRTEDVPQGGGTVKTNVYALFMKSTSAVNVGGQPADVYVTINNTGGAVSASTLPQPDSLSPSTGSVTVRTDGTFDSSLTVNADIIFVKAGTSVGNPGNIIGSQAASPITLTSTNSSWSASPPAGYPGGLPSGGFYPKPVHSPGPHAHIVVPASCGPVLAPAPTPIPVAQTAKTALQPGGSTGQLIARPVCASVDIAQ
jgi:hypothetical protein